ncbi:hypothetical protein NBRC116188_19980 [Oceaniserpentilla sp. 4NH20-0058]|uniref:hypothetical protein n=1 Tax=Oceaniserpentilla sp. 4NH20-0058 TaxID=3127660 RepID=UPI0031063CD2
MKLPITIILVLFTQMAVAGQYSGCTDPQYISYVEKRHAFYEKLDKERYQKALEGMNENEISSYQNVVLSARFDTREIALNNIVAYEKNQATILQKLKNSFVGTSDSIHNINIAKGWLALHSGNEDEAISYLLASTEVKGSPVLGSFGPDKTLIRELYKRGKKEAVLKYLELSESFWNTESAQNFIMVWRRMIKHNCPIQFQFYDTTSIKELGL